MMFINKKIKKFTILNNAKSALKVFTLIILEVIGPIIIGKKDPYKLLSTVKSKIKPLDDELLFIPSFGARIGDMVDLLSLSKPVMLEKSLKMSIIVFDERQFEIASLFKLDLKRIIRVDPGNLDYDFFPIRGLSYFIIFRFIKQGKINYINYIIPFRLLSLIYGSVYNYHKWILNIKNSERKFSTPMVDYETRSSVYFRLERMRFEKGKTIIINPYSNSIKGELQVSGIIWFMN